MLEPKKSKKTIHPSYHFIVIVLVISFVTATAAGALAGLFVSTNLVQVLQGGNLQSLFKSQDEFNKLASSYKAVGNDEAATISAVQKVSPAVVSIVISKDLSQFYNRTGRNIFPFDDFFEFGFPSGQQFQQPQEPAEPRIEKVGGGTGFIITEDGFILTNKHVVSDTEAEYSVVLNDGAEYEAEVIATDPFNDIAVVKIEATDLPTVELGDSDSLQSGQTVIAIGFSLSEYQNAVTKGVVSGVDRRIRASDGSGRSEVIEEAIQTDAAINPGNSGGPLINLNGQVIGVNTAVNRSGQSLGFAIPINAAKKAIESVKKTGKIVRPMLGVRYVMINEVLVEKNDLPVDHGALILRGDQPDELAVMPGSAADKAGLVENDIILELNGNKITQENPLAREISKLSPGDEVEIMVLHRGEEEVLKVTLGEFE